jgi:hypothetical protein
VFVVVWDYVGHGTLIEHPENTFLQVVCQLSKLSFVVYSLSCRSCQQFGIFLVPHAAWLVLYFLEYKHGTYIFSKCLVDVSLLETWL